MAISPLPLRTEAGKDDRGVGVFVLSIAGAYMVKKGAREREKERGIRGV